MATPLRVPIESQAATMVGPGRRRFYPAMSYNVKSHTPTNPRLFTQPANPTLTNPDIFSNSRIRNLIKPEVFRRSRNLTPTEPYTFRHREEQHLYKQQVFRARLRDDGRYRKCAAEKTFRCRDFSISEPGKQPVRLARQSTTLRGRPGRFPSPFGISPRGSWAQGISYKNPIASQTKAVCSRP